MTLLLKVRDQRRRRASRHIRRHQLTASLQACLLLLLQTAIQRVIVDYCRQLQLEIIPSVEAARARSLAGCGGRERGVTA